MMIVYKADGDDVLALFSSFDVNIVTLARDDDEGVMRIVYVACTYWLVQLVLTKRSGRIGCRREIKDA